MDFFEIFWAPFSFFCCWCASLFGKKQTWRPWQYFSKFQTWLT